MKRTSVHVMAALAVTVSAAACAAPSVPPDGSAAATGPAAAGTAFPTTVTNCGRTVTIPSRPSKVVAFDGAAETVFALGAAEQLSGYFGADPKALPADLAAQAGTTTRIGSTFPAPTLEAVTKDKPDLILMYGENEKGGLTGERLDQLGIPHLQLSEACRDKPDATVEGYLGDVQTIADALGRGEDGRRLVAQWRQRLAELPAPSDPRPSVMVSGNVDPKSPFASGRGSFVQDQLTKAGARNVYEDVAKGYLSPSWEDVATRNPDIIVDGSGGMEKSRDALLAHLRANPALAQMTAVEKSRVIAVPFSQNVPGPQAIDGIVAIGKAVAEARG
ncbi:ABC transporter substrate-binding protein [Mobilicoccus caccae]|uniref:Iron compound ABC transporter, substrate-binding protein n=1 Tax=Mobilicoccus caccae TaxID=1859295 RepID=A0ABQ6IUY6_9MICO|nr:ABC transporter substrate-binding protein [Mobilicoccus caccae]GMA41471.1 putative iron compound ABC transporter, substrate-binding protein [Mobilicoccus caccae]